MGRFIKHVRARSNEWVAIHRSHPPSTGGGGGGGSGGGIIGLILLLVLCFAGCWLVFKVIAGIISIISELLPILGVILVGLTMALGG